MIKSFFTISIIIFFYFSFQPLLAQQDVLRWAADAESGAPYVFQDQKNPTKLIGFEVDIIKAIAKKMGMDEQFVQNQWDGLIPGLDRIDYDVAINGIEITPDRQKVVNFSKPYYMTYEQLVVKKGVKGITTLHDLKGKKAGTLKGSLAERILRDADGIEVLTYDSEANSYEDLRHGRRLNAVLLDEPIAKYYVGWNEGFEFVGAPIGEMSYGIAIRKKGTELLNKINKAIGELIASGELREILERWNLWNHLMVAYLKDYNPSNIPHTEYKRFLSYQGKKTTFSMLLDRYMNAMPLFLMAALTTLEISLLSMLLAIVLGLFIALMRVYGPRPISRIAILFIETVRGTPLLLQLFFIFYWFPQVGIILTPFIAAILGLGINYAAYEAENYRAGLFSVPRGQMEAAISLGMRRRDSLRYIILPQAFRLVIPPMTNDFISLLKDSSLVSVITMVELTKVYGILSGMYFDYIGFGIIVASLYLLLGLPFVKLSKVAERKFAYDKRRMI